MRYYFANVLVIAMSLAFLAHFILMAIYGSLLIQELNPVIWALEVTGLIVCIAFALSNLLWRRKR